MFKLSLSVLTLAVIVLFKFDFLFQSLMTYSTMGLAGGLGLMICCFGIIKFEHLMIAVFADSGPLGKFNYYFFTRVPFIAMVLTPFSSVYEFYTRVLPVLALLLLPMIVVCKKMIKLNEKNYSLVDLMNTKIAMIAESSLTHSLVVCFFMLVIDYQDGGISLWNIAIICYFAVFFTLSMFLRFNVTRNVLVDGLTIFSFTMFVFFGGDYKAFHYAEMLTFFGCMYILFTAVDVISLIRYVINPVKFLKSRQVNAVAEMMFSIRRDSNLNYFRYFKNVKLGKVFIHYDSLIGRVDSIMQGDYAILKQRQYDYSMADKLFHVEEKELRQHIFSDFFELSHKFIDEFSALDQYAIFNFGTIQKYMESNSMAYSDLTDDDLKVIEMFHY